MSEQSNCIHLSVGMIVLDEYMKNNSVTGIKSLIRSSTIESVIRSCGDCNECPIKSSLYDILGKKKESDEAYEAFRENAMKDDTAQTIINRMVEESFPFAKIKKIANKVFNYTQLRNNLPRISI